MSKVPRRIRGQQRRDGLLQHIFGHMAAIPGRIWLRQHARKGQNGRKTDKSEPQEEKDRNCTLRRRRQLPRTPCHRLRPRPATHEHE
jgi:hypothetical protein